MVKKLPILIALTLMLCACQDKVPLLLDLGIPRELAEFRKAQVSGVVYGLSFEIPRQQAAPIPSTLELSLEIHDLSQPLYLDFNADPGLLKSLQVNGNPQKIVHQKEHLILEQGLHIGQNSVVIGFDAGQHSLNRNADYLYTLLVPERASTLFPCFDQPDIKANYLLEVLAPEDWKVLSASPLEERKLEGERMRHRFAKSDLMSTYLFSLVAGKFDSRRENPGLFNMEFLFRETDTAKIRASLPQIYDLHQRSIDFLKGYTEYEFPFQKLDFVALPGFQYGGMEHVGAIQYNQASLFLDESATERQLLRRAKLIAHETSHMWFGDLVTMAWFNDVWMKEVFANFMADKIINPTFADMDHALQFMTSHYPSAYAEDRTHGTNAIRQPLGNLKRAGSLYGGIIYNKAPIMMRQLEASIGEGNFRKGIRQYISNYAYGNARWRDLVEILDSTTEQDLENWSEVWVNSPGRPIFTEHLEFRDGAIRELSLSQRAEDGSDNLWPQSFGISLIYPDSVKVIPVTISGERVEIAAAKGLPRPKAIFYNSNAFGYGMFPIRTTDLPLIHGLKNAVSRGYAYLNAYENILACNISTGSGIETFALGLRLESNELIHGMLCNQVGSLFWKYLTPGERMAQQIRMEPLLWKELNAVEHSPNIKKNLYGLWKELAYNESGLQRLHGLWKGEIEIPGLRLNEDDFTDMALTLALYGHGRAQEVLSTAREKIDNADKLARFDFLMPSLSARESARDSFFVSLRDPKMREKESWVVTAAGFVHHPLRQESAIKHLPQVLEMLEEIHRTGDIFFPKRWLMATIGQYQDPKANALIGDYLDGHPDLDPSLKGKLLQATDDLHRFGVMSRRE